MRACIAQHLSEQLKQTFVVENRPGAGSIIGTDAVAKSAPDGYTLLVMSNTHTTNESLVANKPFQLMRDFVPVATLNYSDLLMVVHPSVPAKDLKEFIALAKSKPGELNYASSGAGTPYHMAGELFKAMSGTNIVHVPHKASGEARNAVIGGHVQMMFDAITTMAPNAAAGQVRALGTTGTKRSALTPDVPTVAEAGVPGYEATIWLGVMAPAGTPKDVVDKLNAEIDKVINRPDVKEAWAQAGRRADGDDAGRVRQVSARRHREMGQCREGLRRQGELTGHPPRSARCTAISLCGSAILGGGRAALRHTGAGLMRRTEAYESRLAAWA